MDFGKESLVERTRSDGSFQRFPAKKILLLIGDTRLFLKTELNGGKLFLPERAKGNKMLSEEKIRELEWAATFVKNNKRRQGCRCGGSCSDCKTHQEQSSKINPDAVLALIAHIRGDRIRENRRSPHG